MTSFRLLLAAVLLGSAGAAWAEEPRIVSDEGERLPSVELWQCPAHATCYDTGNGGVLVVPRGVEIYCEERCVEDCNTARGTSMICPCTKRVRFCGEAVKP